MFFWLSCGLAGLSLCALAWALGGPAGRAGRAPGHMDSRFLRLAWPWVQACAVVCAPFISWRLRQRLQRRMQVAGLDAGWKIEQVVALQLVAGISLGGAAAVAGWLYFTLDAAQGLAAACLAGAAGCWWPRRWLAGLAAARQRAMLREYPFMLDMATLCVEAGLSLQGALQQAAQYGPPGPLRDALRHALADMRAGAARHDALGRLAQDSGLAALRQLATVLAQADQLGMSLGPLLRALSEQYRNERFLRAEQLALQAPVKMLFPMVCCIFPCTFLVIGFPVVIRLMEAAS